MKILVSMIQLAIIATIVLPMLTFWQTDKVDKFCKLISPGMSQENYLQLVENHSLKLVEMVGTDVALGQWYSIVKTQIPLVEYQCKTKGMSKFVVKAEVLKSIQTDSMELENN